VSNPPATLTAGASFTITDTVRNQGNARADATKTRYYFSVDTVKSVGDFLLIGARDVPTLLPNTTSTGSKLVQTTGVSPGTYSSSACADDTQLRTEWDETNNCIASTTTVVVGP
jgi:subtilase family serine protease